MTTTTIDCHTCPVRGRHCGDCFVPVLARLWLDPPGPAPEQRPRPSAEEAPEGALTGLPLDSDELDAVSAFVRAGLLHPDEAGRARADIEQGHRFAAG